MGHLASQHDAFAAWLVAHPERRKTRLDVLMQRGILKTIDCSENISMAMNLAPRLPLASGKSGWYLWSAACDFAGMLRYDIPSGIVINWHLQDGLHVHQLSRWMLARHHLVSELSDDFNKEDPLASDKDWSLHYAVCVSLRKH